MKKIIISISIVFLSGCSFLSSPNIEVEVDPLVIEVQEDVFVCGRDKVKDVDGNDYKTAYFDIDGGHDVEKQGQCWMAENLNVGTVILNPREYPSDDGVIEKWCPKLKAKYDVKKEVSCYYGGGGKKENHCFPDMGDIGNVCETAWGAEYNWEEVINYDLESQQGICPLGWEIPSDDVWEVLRENVRKMVVRSDFSDVRKGEVIGYGDKLPVGRKLKQGLFQGIYLEKKGDYVLTPYGIRFLSVNKKWIKDYFLQNGFSEPGVQYELYTYNNFPKKIEKSVLTLEEFKKEKSVPDWVKSPEKHWYGLEYKKYLENWRTRYYPHYSVRCVKK